jgi:hypothetical protein
MVCPDAAITVYREAVVELKPSRRARKATGALKEKP